MRLRNRVAVITGAARGIGAAPARLFAAEGAVVALLDLRGSPGRVVAKEISHKGGEARFVPTVVSHEPEVADAMRTLRHIFDRIDILVNGAGINRKGRVDTLTVEDWDAVREVNVRGMFLTTKHAVPVMRWGAWQSPRRLLTQLFSSHPIPLPS